MDNPVKIGVFFCTCGHMMNDYFDMKALMDYAGKAPGVTYVDLYRSLCTRNGLEWLKARISRSGCDRIVIAGCSPHQHELSFMKVLDDVGLNRYFLTIANIREGCAWVCQNNADCMPKARQMVASAIRRAAVAKPMERVQKKISFSALVIGAGFSGIQMALELDRLGIKPILIEKQPEINRKNSFVLSPCMQGTQGAHGTGSTQCTGKHGTGTQCAQGMAEGDMFSSKVKELGDRKIEILTSSEVTEVSGGPGAFRVTLDSMGQEKNVEVGSIVISTGSQSRPGQGVTALRSSHRIVSLSRLRDMVTSDRRSLEQILVTPDKLTKYVCFILAGSEANHEPSPLPLSPGGRGQGEGRSSQGQVNGQCQGAFAKTSTIMALNEAIALKRQFKAEVMIVARDITVCGTEMESLYRQARQEGVLFFRSPSKERQGDGETGRGGDVPQSTTAQSTTSPSIDFQPQVSIEKGVITVRVYDPALAPASASAKVEAASSRLNKRQDGASTINNGNNGGYGDGGCGRIVTICADLLVFEDEIFPSDGTESLSTALRVNLNRSGFYQEENIHLKPNLSNRKGVFLAGSCHGKEDIYETLCDVRSVAMAVYSSLSGGCAIPGGCGIPGYLETERKIIIDTDKCALCLTCIRSCPHRAIEIGEVTAGQKWGAKVIPEACQGCGICAGECPAKAIEMVHYSDNQIFSELTFEG